MFFKYIDNPILFQGDRKKKNYFEGWYFKQVSSDLKSTISIIFGISKEKDDPHAFIQSNISIENNQYETHYHRFPIEDFKFSNRPFYLKIGNNIFNNNELILDLKDRAYNLSGKIEFSKFTPIKTNILFPNIMGFFAYIPFMECYHGVVSMNHRLSGYLKLNGELINFTGGKGYIEKDWGTSFPKKYIWLQCNNFPMPNSSVFCSVAFIPYLGMSFQGFICNVLIENMEYRFATYNGSKINKINVTKGSVEIDIIKNNLKLNLVGKITNSGDLKAPVKGCMKKVIKEGLNGVVMIKLSDKNGNIIFEEKGYPCAVEIVNY